jgi:hypothetical protein
MRVIGIGLLLFLSLPVFGQVRRFPDESPRNLIGFGGGAAVPGGDLSLLDTSPMLSISYARRVTRFAQLETGIDLAFGAADVREFQPVPIGFGFARIRDNQLAWPFGGRLVLPVGRRFELTGGAGGAYLRYGEYLNQPSDFVRIACPLCRSRSGWGYYTVAGFATALDRRGLFWLGGTAKRYQVRTDGEGFGEIPFGPTRDRWTMIYADFTFRF